MKSNSGNSTTLLKHDFHCFIEILLQLHLGITLVVLNFLFWLEIYILEILIYWNYTGSLLVVGELGEACSQIK